MKKEPKMKRASSEPAKRAAEKLIGRKSDMHFHINISITGVPDGEKISAALAQALKHACQEIFT